jgi:hypothetical protein
LKLALQVEPQLIPLGLEVTVPVPMPALVTVTVSVTSTKLAVTVVAPLTVTMQVVAEPLQALPDHPMNVDPVAAVAVRVIIVPLA